MASVDLHQRYHEHQAARAVAATPTIEATQTPTVSPLAEPTPVAPQETHQAVHHSLLSIKRGLLALTILFGLITIFLIYQSTRPTSKPAAVSTPETENKGSDASSPISCLSETGPDATTTSPQFSDMEGTQCLYRSGPNEETLVLNGKLTGRNTEGTGMSATININGKDCNGGESLNYSRTYAPMYANCVFVVPANSSVAIKWRFLSPFGGTAAVIRSNKNIAPSISGSAIPKIKNQP